MAAVALANGLNANLVRRWVVTEERAQPATSIEAVKMSVASPVENATFIPIALEGSPVNTPQSITIELRRGAMVAKVDWPLTAATECSAWLRELLR
jgi:transposase-like protein